MTSMLVRFEQPNQVVDFVNTISLFDYDADIKYGRQIVVHTGCSLSRNFTHRGIGPSY